MLVQCGDAMVLRSNCYYGCTRRLILWFSFSGCVWVGDCVDVVDDDVECTGLSRLVGDFGETTVSGTFDISVSTEVVSLCNGSVELGAVEEIVPGMLKSVSIISSLTVFYSSSISASAAIVTLRVISSFAA